jgi:hypothetical protein
MGEADELQWEYQWFYSTGDDALNDMLRKANSLGEQRWEMVNFVMDQAKPFTAACFFKRPRLAGTTPDAPEPPRRFL